MFTFLKRTFLPKDISEVVELLNDSKQYPIGRDYIVTYEGLRDNKHGNSYLTYAIVWGKTDAAIDILTTCHKQGLDYKDTFESSRSTALILCAKTGLNDVAMLLIGLGADVNQKDYRGFTALHYACLYRNNNLICALLAAGALTTEKNIFGKYPLDYYKAEINLEQLSYNYGIAKNFSLNHRCDWDNSFQGTKSEDLSALRWFIINLIKNFKLGKEESVDSIRQVTDPVIWLSYDQKIQLLPEQKNYSIYDFAVLQLQYRKPVADSRLYDVMMNSFITYRESLKVESTICECLSMTAVSKEKLLALINQSPICSI